MIGNKVHDSIDELLKDTFDASGKCIGCRCITKHVIERMNESDTYIEERHKRIVAYVVSLNKPVLLNDRSYLLNMNLILDGDALEEDATEDTLAFDVDCGNQESLFISLSPTRKVHDSSSTKQGNNNMNDHELYDQFQAVFNVLETEEEHKEAMEMMKEMYHYFNKNKHKNPLSQDDVVMSNEYGGNKILGNKRHKSAYEK